MMREKQNEVQLSMSEFRRMKLCVKTRICPIHFTQEDNMERKQQMLNYSPSKCQKIKDDSIPSLKLLLKECPNHNNERSERCKTRERENVVKEENSYLNGKSDDLLVFNTQLKKEKQIILENLEILSPYFTTGKIKFILNKKKRILWSNEDNAAAISLRTESIALKYSAVSLPSTKTVRSWTSKIDCSPELLTDIENVQLPYCTIKYMFQTCCFDTMNQKICRATFNHQSSYGFFDTPMTANLLKELVKQVEARSDNVMSVTIDMRGSPHLLKLSRNNFLD
ncbi:hypothetical protein PR048_012662 [Dryococelus australis]|uniref:THAP-type domain-containing protein n=1 Tax=Dryococelus australis TaxID=614101 RepID=A0ABQ9HQ52_9NEOP|nr:hypothetical protein PR048_012662 [Dryococelus australis]